MTGMFCSKQLYTFLTLAIILLSVCPLPAQSPQAAHSVLTVAHTRYVNGVRDGVETDELERLKDEYLAALAAVRGLTPETESEPDLTASAPAQSSSAPATTGNYDPEQLIQQLEDSIATAQNLETRSFLKLQLAELIARLNGDWQRAQTLAEEVLATGTRGALADRARLLQVESIGRLKLAAAAKKLNALRLEAARRYTTWKSTSWWSPLNKIKALGSYTAALVSHRFALHQYRKVRDEVEESKQIATRTGSGFDWLTDSTPVTGNTVTLLQNGKVAYETRYRIARAATKYIYLQYLYYKNDESGNILADILIEKARQGVDVRVIVTGLDMNSVLGFNFANHIAHKLRAGGVKMLFKDAPNRVPSKVLNCNHQKLFIVDDRLAITGGMNISDEYAMGSVRMEGWRDTDVLLEGPIVAEMKDLFLVNCELALNEPNIIRDDAAELAREQKKFADFEMEVGSAFTPGDNPRLIKEVLKEYFPTPPVVRDAEVRFIDHHPADGDDHVLQVLLWYLDRASREVVLETPYFIPSKPLRASLIKAALRGVKVVMITNSMYSNDMGKYIVYASHSYFQELLDAGVQIYEWYGAQTLHSKVNYFDGAAVTIGSYNLNSRSHILDTENIALIEDARFAAHVKTMLDRDLEYCYPVTREEAAGWKKNFSSNVQMKLFRLLGVVF